VFSNNGLIISIVYISVMKRESKLNSDDQQFRQYQNDDQSSLISTHWPLKHLPWHMTLEIKVLV